MDWYNTVTGIRKLCHKSEMSLYGVSILQGLSVDKVKKKSDELNKLKNFFCH